MTLETTNFEEYCEELEKLLTSAIKLMKMTRSEVERHDDGSVTLSCDCGKKITIHGEIHHPVRCYTCNRTQLLEEGQFVNFRYGWNK
jgi:molybdenum cofactor biosynthesis enzyme MoaA